MVLKQILYVAVAVASVTADSTISQQQQQQLQQQSQPQRSRRMKKDSAKPESAAAKHHSSRTAPATGPRNDSPKVTNRHERTDDWYDDYFHHPEDDDLHYHYESHDGHNDHVNHGDDYYDDYYNYDDYYYSSSSSKGKGKSGKKSKSSKSSKSSKKGSSKGKGKGNGGSKGGGGNNSPRPTVLLEARAASPAALLSVAAGGASADVLELGTVYPFGNVTYNADSWGDMIIPLFVEGDESEANIRLDGYCTRTGTSENTVEGYCHFTYTAIDPASLFMLGKLVAEGPLANPNIVENNPCSGLQVTGGTGIFMASVGLIQFCPSVLNDLFMPPLLQSLPLGDDLFEGADAYEHILSVYLDEAFAFL